MKKQFIRMSLLGFAMASFAHAYAATTVIPVAKPGFAVSVTGLYLQPNASNLQYAVYTHPLPLPAPNWSQVLINPGYSAGIDVGVQYNFADANNQVNLDWFYLNTDDSDSFIAKTGGGKSSVAPPYYFGPLAQELFGSSATSTVKFTINDVRLAFGRLVNLGSSIQLEPFAGINYAYLKQNIVSTYQGVDSFGNPYYLNTNNTSKFSGIGPRLGIKAAYFFTNRFSISAGVGGSLLAGSVSSNTNFNSLGGGNKVLTPTKLANQSQNMIVPEVDSKVEASYTLPINAHDSSINFALGYLLAVYINGINQVVPASLVPGAFNGGTIAIETVSQTQSNINLNGPYASVTWKI